MPYRLRYTCDVDFVPPGVGLGQQALIAGGAPNAGQQQTIEFFNNAMPASNTFLSADVTALLAAMSADLSAQLNVAATLARIQGFATGSG